MVAVLAATALAACTAGGQAETPRIGSPATSSPDSSPRVNPESHCSGTASASVNRKLRRVRIELTPCQVVPGEASRAVLRNIGKSTVGYGPGFKLERKTRDGWRWINKRQAFPLPLFYLKPGHSSEPEPISVYLDKPQPLVLQPGLYRVTKTIDLTPGEPRPPRVEVRARFRVVAEP